MAKDLLLLKLLCYSVAGSDNDLFADIISSHHDHVSNFDTFGKQYSKQYNSREEHTTRYATYLNNVR